MLSFRSRASNAFGRWSSQNARVRRRSGASRAARLAAGGVLLAALVFPTIALAEPSLFDEYALTFGMFSGFLASWFVAPGPAQERNEIESLRQEIASLRALLEQRSYPSSVKAADLYSTHALEIEQRHQHRSHS
jgi:hypothetical protein